MTWTHFWDMNSGGGQKLEWAHIFIEAPEAEARAIFYNRFGRNPDRVTCTCCGSDYAVDEDPTLEQATGYHRNCNNLETPRDPETGKYKKPDDPWFDEHYYLEPEDEEEARRRGYTVQENTAREIGRKYGSEYGRYMTVAQFFLKEGALAIYAHEIKDEERKASIPAEGYVWVGE